MSLLEMVYRCSHHNTYSLGGPRAHGEALLAPSFTTSLITLCLLNALYPSAVSDIALFSSNPTFGQVRQLARFVPRLLLF